MAGTILANDATATWRNPYWGSLSGDLAKLRPIFESLSNFLARPTFHNGVQLGDGTAPVDTSQPYTPITSTTIDDMQAAVDGMGTSFAEIYADLAAMQVDLDALTTNPIDGTRITDGSISTPKLAANSVTATKLAAMNIGVGKWIASTSYIAGSSGWIISADGSAEFNNVTIRNAAHVGGSISIGALSISSAGVISSTAGVTLGGTIDVNFQLRFRDSGGGAGVIPYITQTWAGATGYTLQIHGGDQGTAFTGPVVVPQLTTQGTATALTVKNSGGGTTATLSPAGSLSVQSATMNGLTVNGTFNGRDINITGFRLITTSITMVVLGTNYDVSLGGVDTAGVGYRQLRVPN